jgi:hypothetical protein
MSDFWFPFILSIFPFPCLPEPLVSLIDKPFNFTDRWTTPFVQCDGAEVLPPTNFWTARAFRAGLWVAREKRECFSLL